MIPVRVSNYGLLIAFWSFSAFAVNDQILQASPTEIKVQVVNSCELNGQQGGVDLGELDFGRFFSLDSAVYAETTAGNGSLSLRCTPGTDARILLNAGINGGDINSRALLNSPSGQTLSYQLYTTPARNTVWDDVVGVPATFLSDSVQSFTVYGTIPAQATPVSGLYTDSVTVTVQY